MSNHTPGQGSITINGKTVLVDWTARAQRALVARSQPLIVEMELYFSCLIKKFMHFRDQSRGDAPVMLNEKLGVYFRPVMSTACTMEEAARLGRQPEVEITTAEVRRIAPKRLKIDFKSDQWRGEFEL